MKQDIFVYHLCDHTSKMYEVRGTHPAYVSMHICIYAYMYLCMYVCMSVMDGLMHACMDVCMVWLW